MGFEGANEKLQLFIIKFLIKYCKLNLQYSCIIIIMFPLQKYMFVLE